MSTPTTHPKPAPWFVKDKVIQGVTVYRIAKQILGRRLALKQRIG